MTDNTQLTEMLRYDIVRDIHQYMSEGGDVFKFSYSLAVAELFRERANFIAKTEVLIASKKANEARHQPSPAMRWVNWDVR